MSWRELHLGDVIKLKRGHDLPASARITGDVPIVSSSGITGYHNLAKVSGPGVVTGRYGTLGEVHYIEGDYWPLNTALYVEDFKGNHPRFVAYLLMTLELGQQNAAGAVPGVNRNTLHQMPVRVPSVEVQHQIASVLATYDDLIETNRRRIALLEESARLLYCEWFVNLRFSGHEHAQIVDGVPVGWRRENLYDIATLTMGFPFQAALFNPDGLGKPAVRIRDIPEAMPKTWTTEEPASAEYEIQRGDFLIGMDGIFHMNHWVGEPAWLVQRVCRVRPKLDIYRGFLALALYEPIKHFEATISGATVAHLGAKHLKTIELLVPPLTFSEQLSTLNGLLEQKLLLVEQNRAAQQARDALLPKLMSGALQP